MREGRDLETGGQVDEAFADRIVQTAGMSFFGGNLWNAHSEFGKGASAMTKNMGTLDRIIRTVVAVSIVALYLAGRISGTAAVLLGIVAAIFLVTSSVGVCPGYLPFGFSTRRQR